MFKKSIISVLMLISSFAYADDNTPIGSDWTVKLDNALINHKYGQAAKIAKNENSAALIGRLKPWAEKNKTVAQWLYAQALYDDKRYEDSAKWVFIAFFFTRYDASLCTNQNALKLEKPIVDSYFNIVDKSRSDRDTINIAVEGTTQYLESITRTDLLDRNPEWICELTDKLKGEPLVIPTKEWYQVFKNRFSSFIETTTGKSN